MGGAVLIDGFKRYCTNTSIHGFFYLIEGRNAFEKFFWLLCIVGSFTGSTYMVVNNLVYWNNNPTLTTAQTYSQSVRKIQFPTVTVCPVMNNDRWGATRKVLNLFEFPCNSTVSCQIETALGVEIRDFLLDVAKTFKGKMIEAYLGKELLTVDRDVHNLILQAISDGITANGYQFLDELRHLVLLKVSGQASRKEVEEKLNLNLNITNLSSSISVPSLNNFQSNQSLIIEMQTEAAVTSYFLMIPDSAKLGNLISYFASDVMKGTFTNVFSADLLEVEQYKRNGFDMPAVEKKLHTILEKALNTLAGENLGISLLDLPAILDRPKNSIWRERFAYSAANLKNRTAGLEEKLMTHLDLVSKVMLHSSLMAHTTSYSAATHNVIAELAAALNFSVNKNLIMDDINSSTMVLHAQYGPESFELNPVSTDRGYCYSINAMDMDRMFAQNNSFENRFKSIFNEKKEDLFMNQGWGDSFQGILILDAKNLRRNRNFRGSFHIGIGETGDYFAQQADGVIAKTGQKTILKSTPLELDATANFKLLNESQRHCMYPNEAPQDKGSLFANLTHRKCVFMCSLFVAQSMSGSCIPWNLPQNNSSSVVCDGNAPYKLTCMMFDQDVISECYSYCPADCKSLEFRTNVVYEEFDLDEMIQGQPK
jgi:hypothetical protein